MINTIYNAEYVASLSQDELREHVRKFEDELDKLFKKVAEQHHYLNIAQAELERRETIALQKQYSGVTMNIGDELLMTEEFREHRAGLHIPVGNVFYITSSLGFTLNQGRLQVSDSKAPTAGDLVCGCDFMVVLVMRLAYLQAHEGRRNRE